MAKKKKMKIGNGQIITMGMALVSVVLAIVGLFVPYFVAKGENALTGKSTNAYTLFSEDMTNFTKNTDMSVSLVRTFAIIAVVLAVLAAVGAVLVSLRILPRNGLLKLLFAAATVVIGVLALVFTFTLCGQLVSADISIAGLNIAKLKWTAGVGAYLLGIGTILGGVTLLLAKK